jgi:hypothetical protein
MLQAYREIVASGLAQLRLVESVFFKLHNNIVAQSIVEVRPKS